MRPLLLRRNVNTSRKLLLECCGAEREETDAFRHLELQILKMIILAWFGCHSFCR